MLPSDAVFECASEAELLASPDPVFVLISGASLQLSSEAALLLAPEKALPRRSCPKEREGIR
jgi:hypothetical protein